ncbi:MAG: hypothetical protein QE487_16315 [Fluviicola sp.]|nr:hypothetical protein [Fluviicola sp.]
MNTITISEGKTNSLIVPAIFGILIGIGFTFLIPIAGLIILAVSISLFSATNGLEITNSGTGYRKYMDYFGLRYGTWHSLNSVGEVELKLSVDADTVRTYTGRTELKSVTYDLIIELESGDKQPIYEFLEYKSAMLALEQFATALQVRSVDYVAIKLEENRLKRENR